MIQAVFFDKTYTLIQQDPDVMKEIDKNILQFLKTKEIYINLDQITSLREKNQKLYRMGTIKSWKDITKRIFMEFGISPPPNIEEGYRKTHVTMGKLYPHSKEVLEEIKKLHLKLGLITESATNKVESELKRENINDLFDVVVVSSVIGENKPSFKLFQVALENLNVRPGNSIMVGDNLLKDVVPAKQLGFKTVWIRQGPYAEKGLAQLSVIRPDFIVEGIREVLAIVRQLTESNTENT